MMRLGAILLALAWTALVVPSALAENILANPGFETGELPPWFQDANFSPGEPEDWHVTGADAHSGAFSATVVGNKSIRQDFGPVPTDDITELSFWLKQPEFSSAFSHVDLFYSDASSDGGPCLAPFDAEGWAFCDMTSLLDPGNNLVGFHVFGYEGGGAAEDRTFLDDATIETEARIPGPGALLLLGAGLVMLVAIGRRIHLSTLTR